MKHSREIQFMDPPNLWEKSVVVTKEAPRWWTEEGPERNLRHWFGEVHKMYPNNLIPFQWVSRYVGVSIAAVHKRAKAGRLTVLSFVETENRKNIFGNIVVTRTRRRYDYAMISECNQWHDLLMELYDLEEEVGDDKRR